MLAMQYVISLPGDYDMDIIKNRVRNNGHKTDGFPDLRMKAYLVAEKSKYGNQDNQYAPFYLWDKVDGMNQFLLGGPFNNILNSFGRPAALTWMVLHAHVTKPLEPQYAFVRIDAIDRPTDFGALRAREGKEFAACLTESAITAYVAAYNPQTWELCHFHMSGDAGEVRLAAGGRTVYEVQHIS